MTPEQMPEPDGRMAELDGRIRAFVAAQPFAVRWQIRDLSSARSGTIGDGAHLQVPSFSTRKVSVLLACLMLVRQGRLRLDERWPVTEELRDGVQAGIMKDLAAGVELTLEDHLRQMMSTSDNICTQLVFDAVGGAARRAPGPLADLYDDDRSAALQQVNDSCAWAGLHATLHREVFPRSAELAWHHSIEQMTVTTAEDQAHLLAQLGRGTQDAGAAAALELTPQLCRLAVELMQGIHTPLLGAETSRLRFAEKNGRGLRSLSQIGLALTDDGAPAAAVALFAETVPAQLPDGRPGRIAAYGFFSQVGRALEAWHVGERSQAGQRQTDAAVSQTGVLTAGAVGSAHDGSVTSCDTVTSWDAGGRRSLHPLAGTGKLFAAVTLAELFAADAGLAAMPVTITGAHRRAAAVGPLRIPADPGERTSGAPDELTLSLHDALALIIGTSDAAAALALRQTLESRGLDLVAESRALVERALVQEETAPHTAIAGLEDPEGARGDLLTGRTSPDELCRLLMLLAGSGDLLSGGPRVLSPAGAQAVLGWMAQVFEPSGLARSLPGFGPKKVPQWTVSGTEFRAGHLDDAEGWSSVLITCRPGAVPTEAEVCWMAAHVPTGQQASDLASELPHIPHRRGWQAAHVLSDLGLYLYLGRAGG